MALAPSTQSRKNLPAPASLKRLCQSLALLDALIAAPWQSRCASFQLDWGLDRDVASLRGQAGDDVSLLFHPDGAVIKGFAQRAPMASYPLTHGTPWPGVLDALPPLLARLLEEPAFSVQTATFCLWRECNDLEWMTGPISFPPGADPDGSASLLRLLDGDPATYQTWAQEYYEMRLDQDAIARVYRHEPLTNALIASFNPKASLHSLANDLDEIGYPRTS